MGRVFEDFAHTLTQLQTQCANDPRKQMIRLFLLALEREELVSVGYRESLMTERLQAMPITDDIREVIRHALVWIWKDEEMHAIYIRGAILRLGSLRLRLMALLMQLMGGLGGWASSALQHTRWTSAPLSRLLAKFVTVIGALAGKVPKDVRQHLCYGPFRNFCLFNVDAERTAWLCWDRLAELARSQADCDSGMVDDFARIAQDEEQHARLFEILATALDEQDQLVAGETVATLSEKIRQISEFMLPHAMRRITTVDQPLGSGGRVWSVRGMSADHKRALFRQLLEDAELRTHLQSRADALGKGLRDMRIAIKPTFMMGYHRKDLSPITDPELLEDLAAYLQELGCKEISVVEGRNIYERFFQRRTVADVAEYFRLGSPRYRIVDSAAEQVPHRYARGLAQSSIGRTWQGADFRLSFGKLRSHPIELALLSLGNVEWVGARCDEYLFLERQADRTTAVMMLLNDFPPHFALIDGYDTAPDGLVGVMGSPRPRHPRRLYAGADALAVDTVAARHLGVRHPRQSSLLQAACHWFGGWSDKIEVVGCDEPVADWRGPYSNEWWALLSVLAFPVYVMGSSRGRLFVPEMDEVAFPPSEPVDVWMKLGRRAVRRLLGLRHRT